MDILLSHTTALTYLQARRSLEGLTRSGQPLMAPSAPVMASQQAMLAQDLAPDPAQAEIGPEQAFETLHSQMGTRRRREGTRPHLLSQAIPTGLVLLQGEHLGICSPELVFIQLARRLPPTRAIILGSELCASYRTCATGPVRRTPLTTPENIMRALEACAAMPGVTKARRAARYLIANAASQDELRLALLLALPRALGGYGLPKPLLNASVTLDSERDGMAPAQASSLAPSPTSITASLWWPQARLAVMVRRPSRPHVTSGSLARKDGEHLGSGRVQVLSMPQDSARRIDLVERLAERIARALRLRPQPACETWELRRARLRVDLAQPPL